MSAMSLGDIPIQDHQGCIIPIIIQLLLLLPPVLSASGVHADCIELITSFWDSKKLSAISRVASAVSFWKSATVWEYLGVSFLTSSIALRMLSFVSSIERMVASCCCCVLLFSCCRFVEDDDIKRVNVLKGKKDCKMIVCEIHF